jgi:hypothetical protein
MGSYRDDFVYNIIENKLFGFVNFKGWLDKKDMLKTINNHHLALFSSPIEGYPNSLLDYIFAKVPIISSNIPAIKAVGKNLIMYFEPGNIRDLDDKVMWVYSNNKECIKNARSLFEEKLDNNNIYFASTKFIKLLK